MKVDTEGNVYCGGSGGLWIMDRNGNKLGRIVHGASATTNLAFLIYARALLQYDIGGASAGGVVAIVLANIVAFFLVRSIARRLEV